MNQVITKVCMKVVTLNMTVTAQFHMDLVVKVRLILMSRHMTYQLIQFHKHIIWENLLKLNGPKLLSQRMETWIFSLIVRQVAENIYTTVINQLTCFVYFIHYIQGLF